MADPLEGLLDDTTEGANAATNDAAVTNKQDDAADQITVSRAEFDALKAKVSEADGVKEALDEIKALTAARQAPTQHVQQDEFDPRRLNDQFFVDPGTSTTEIARAIVNKEVGPLARQFAASLGGTAIRNFKFDKSGDKFYAAVAPIFDKKVANLDMTWLGSLENNVQHMTLQEAWNASVGEYVNSESTKRAASKPVNLGGGGSGGGTSIAGKTLAEVDPETYRLARQANLSEEEMAEILKENYQ